MGEIEFQKMYKKLIKRFVLASIILFTVFFVKQIIIHYQVIQSNNSTYIMNVAGRQRMLSQKITKDLLLIQKKDDTKIREVYIKDLEESLALFEESHKELVNLNESEEFLNHDITTISHMYQELELSYKAIFDTAYSITDEIKSGINSTKMNTYTNLIMENEPVYLKQMDEIVGRYDLDAKLWLETIQKTHMILFFIIVCITVFIIFLIFIPLIRHLKNSFRNENEGKKNLIKMLNIRKGAVYIIKKDGEILFANRDATNLIYYENGSAGPSFISEQIKWANLDIMKLMEQVGEDESRLEDVEAVIIGKEGVKSVHILSAVSCIYQNTDAIMISMYDITAQKNSELELKNIAIKDELTGMYNRHFLESIINEEMERADRYEMSLSCALLDLDHFKRVNDTWGHPVGDSVLKFTANIIMKTIRLSDYAVRIGGEEFLVLMPNTDSQGAVTVAEKIRRAVEESIHPVTGQFTASLGVAERSAGESYHDLYKRIDGALYEAKNTGRNRVTEAAKIEMKRAATGLEWNSNWNCGETEIDDQHKNLFMLVLQLVSNSDKHIRQEELIHQMDKIIEHVVVHFDYEEKALMGVRYEDLENHKTMHEYMLNRAEEIKKEIVSGKIDRARAFAIIFNEIIVGHFLSEDTKFFQCFQKEE